MATDVTAETAGRPSSDVDTASTADHEVVESGAPPTDLEEVPPRGFSASLGRRFLVVGIPFAFVLALSGVGVFQGVHLLRERERVEQRAAFLSFGEQAALNLTTIDWQHVDENIRRVLDSSTGAFHDEFAQRSQPFADVVTKVQSKSEGKVTLAGVESASDGDARVLVAVNVATTLPNTPQPQSRSWRMRITVTKTGEDLKVSNVEFVP
jgi:Mce-associated membrane protein